MRSPLSQRIIGVTAKQLAGIDTVLAVAYGAGKAEAVRWALTSGLVNALVTHSELARIVLSATDAAPAGRAGRTPALLGTSVLPFV